MTQVLNIADADKVIMSMRGCKVLAQNVPACCTVQTDPNAWGVENPFYFNWLFLGEMLLDGHGNGGTHQFPIPFETVIRKPDDQIKYEHFDWGRRYKEVGYFFQYPDKPGFGSIYSRSPFYKVVNDHGTVRSTSHKPCLPSLDLVEIWQNGGDDGHTQYYCEGMMLVPTQYWGAVETDDWYNGSMYEYPSFVWDLLQAQKEMLYAMSNLANEERRSERYFDEDYDKENLERSKKRVASCVEAMREDLDPVNLDEANKD